MHHRCPSISSCLPACLACSVQSRAELALSDLHAIVTHTMYTCTTNPKAGWHRAGKDQILGIFRKRLKSPSSIGRPEPKARLSTQYQKQNVMKTNKLLFPSRSCFLTHCFPGARKQWPEIKRSNATQMRPFRARNDAKQE